MKKSTEGNRKTGRTTHGLRLIGGKKATGSPARLQDLTEQLRQAEIDVLCCQGIQRTFDGRHDQAREIAESMPMTYFISANDFIVSTGRGAKEMIVSGISILSGANVWMPSSGSFSLPVKDSDKKMVVQFAVIRKNHNSVLVINTEFSADPTVQLQQLRSVFSHQHLHEHYGAVVLCSKSNIAVSKQDLQSAIALSTYKLAKCATEGDGTREMVFDGDDFAIRVLSCEFYSDRQPTAGAIYTLVARNLPPASVRFNGAAASFLVDSARPSRPDFKRGPAGKKKLSLQPPYSEPWIDPMECVPGYLTEARQHQFAQE